jgi:uncharacterized protein (DUF433 family)
VLGSLVVIRRRSARFRAKSCFNDAQLPLEEYSSRMNERWIVADAEHLAGKPRVRGTRISVALILESLAAGMSIAEIVEAYPTLSEEGVKGVLTELSHRDQLAA